MSDLQPIRGRGAVSNPAGRFETRSVVAVDDGWSPREVDAPPHTTVTAEPCRRIITTNASPDVPFDQSINPYRGCEHGCVYCYARPSHAFLDLSPGLDFETRIFFKEHAAERLREELSRRKYRCKPINIGANTDPYQPIERKLKVTRDLLEVMAEFRHPVTLITKGTLIVRDLDLLADLASENLVSVMVSVTTLKDELKRRLEPRAPAGASRLKTVRTLAKAGIPVGVLVAPVIPAINDEEIETILDACAEAGARNAGYILLRLPFELKQLFEEWLEAHYPQRAAHVMSLLRGARGGRANDPRFGMRMSGSGPYANMIRKRFEVAARRNRLTLRERVALDTHRFKVPEARTPQLSLL